MKAIAVRQPWAWLIIHGGKDIENRTWTTRFRGRVLIHASNGMSEDEYLLAFELISQDRHIRHLVESIPAYDDLERGGIIGEVDVIDCVSTSSSPWFMGPFGHVLSNPRPLDFRPCKGSLGYYEVKP
jgi:hypothetical protein